MLATVKSYGLAGLAGFPVMVEVDCSPGLPHWEAVGLPDAAVKESRERVRAALKNSGFAYPQGRIVVKLAPADLRTEGPIYDLAIAVGTLAASGQTELREFSGATFIGELSLDGQIRPVNGILPMAIDARQRGIRTMVVPRENAAEAARAGRWHADRTDRDFGRNGFGGICAACQVWQKAGQERGRGFPRD